MAEHGYDDLARDLAALGRAVDVPAPGPSLATAVLERLRRRARREAWRRPGRDADWSRSRWRWRLACSRCWRPRRCARPSRTGSASAACGWSGATTPAPTADPTPPTVSPGVSLADAAAMVGFTVSVPEALGEPDGVEVSDDRRMVSMSWTTDDEGVLRLDQFDATLDFSVLKTAPDVQYAAVNDTDALWFEEPHEVALLEPDGTQVTHSARLAGHTLIWMRDGVTLRLEGDVELSRAVDIAESAVAVD